jgi:hypothetical protein
VNRPLGQPDAPGGIRQNEEMQEQHLKNNVQKQPIVGVEWRKRSLKMKTKVLLAVVALSYAPLGVAGNKAQYPNERVAEFVIEKLDVTSLPSAFRPKKEKGKKTFAEYGFTVQTVDETEAVIEAAGGVKRLAIKVLDQKPSGIYVCVAEPGENGGQAATQSVLVLKRNDPSALLKGRESFREFAACPVIGGSDSTANSY